MPEQHAVHTGWLGPMEILVISQPGGECCQVFERHLPDVSVLMPPNSMQVGSELGDVRLHPPPGFHGLSTWKVLSTLQRFQEVLKQRVGLHIVNQPRHGFAMRSREFLKSKTNP